MKKTNNAAKSIKLELKKETLANLTNNMLKEVVGGAPPNTHNTACGTTCLPSQICD